VLKQNNSLHCHWSVVGEAGSCYLGCGTSGPEDMVNHYKSVHSLQLPTSLVNSVLQQVHTNNSKTEDGNVGGDLDIQTWEPSLQPKNPVPQCSLKKKSASKYLRSNSPREKATIDNDVYHCDTHKNILFLENKSELNFAAPQMPNVDHIQTKTSNMSSELFLPVSNEPLASNGLVVELIDDSSALKVDSKPEILVNKCARNSPTDDSFTPLNINLLSSGYRSARVTPGNQIITEDFKTPGNQIITEDFKSHGTQIITEDLKTTGDQIITEDLKTVHLTVLAQELNMPDFYFIHKLGRLGHQVGGNVDAIDRGSRDQFVCVLCGVTINWRRSFCRHMREKHASALASGMSPNMARVEVKDGSLIKMSDYLIMESQVKKVRPIEKQDLPGNFPCSECGKVFHRERFLKRHKAVHEKGKEILCDVCTKTFKNQTNFKKHMLTVHKTEKGPYKCKQCDFISSVNILIHKHRQVHPDNSLLCEVCGSAYVDKSTLIKHMRVHDISRRFPCQHKDCTLRFRSEAMCKAHMAAHLTEGKFRCSECGYLFRKKHHLKRHQKLVHNVIFGDDGGGTKGPQKLAQNAEAIGVDINDIRTSYLIVEDSLEGPVEAEASSVQYDLDSVLQTGQLVIKTCSQGIEDVMDTGETGSGGIGDITDDTTLVCQTILSEPVNCLVSDLGGTEMNTSSAEQIGNVHVVKHIQVDATVSGEKDYLLHTDLGVKSSFEHTLCLLPCKPVTHMANPGDSCCHGASLHNTVSMVTTHSDLSDSGVDIFSDCQVGDVMEVVVVSDDLHSETVI